MMISPPEADLRNAGDSALVDAAVRGDGAAFSEIVLRYEKRLFRFCRRLTGSREAAEDLAQESFMRAWQRLETYDTGARFWPWLATIARRVRVDELRLLESSIAMHTLDEANASRSARYRGTRAWEEDVERRIVLTQALQKVPHHERRLIWRHSVDGDDYVSLAAEEHVTVDAIRNRSWRVRRLLQLWLSEVRVLVAPGALWRTLRRKARAANPNLPSLDKLAVGVGSVATLAVLSVSPFTFDALDRAMREDNRTGRPARSVAEQAPSRTPAHATPDGEATPSPQPVNASLDLGERHDDAVAPSSGTLAIDVRDGDGNLLYHDEYWFTCHGQGSNVLIREGPVRAAC